MRARLLILLLATLLQGHQLTQDNRFHPDEAYFMTFARNASVNGDWMLAGSLDKPPFSIYVSAVSMMFFGTTTDANGVLHLDPHIGEFAGRLPNVFLAILLVAVMMRLADDLYHDEQVTMLVGLFSAISPYMIAFGATAFTDMSLLFWLVISLWLTVRKKWGWAGIALGLAFWSKQQALFYLPFVIIFILYKCRREQACLFPTVVSRLIMGLMISVLALLLWDVSRPETSIFLLGTVNNAPDTLFVVPSQYGYRLAVWAYWGAWLIGHPLWTFIALLVVVMGGAWHLFKREASYGIDALFCIFIVGYITLHTVLAFNQYDRYLLLILPPLILLSARGFKGFLEFALKRGAGGHGGVARLYLVSVLLTVTMTIPIGGDKGDYRGIDDLADYLNDKPIATVIYDRWLGWELSYYMGQWTNKRRVYFPTPQALAEGAIALDEIGDRYLVAPLDQPIEEWLSALENAGFMSAIDYQTERFIVYRLSEVVSDA